MQPALTRQGAQQDWSRRAGPFWALIVGVVLVLSLLQWRPVNAALASEGILPQRSGFTELAFDRPGVLPKHPAAGSVLVVPFALTNHEGLDRSYGWQSTLTSTCAAPLSQQGSALVRDGRRAIVVVRLAVAATGCPGLLSVRLLSAPQRISFALAPVGGKR